MAPSSCVTSLGRCVARLGSTMRRVAGPARHVETTWKVYHPLEGIFLASQDEDQPGLGQLRRALCLGMRLLTMTTRTAMKREQESLQRGSLLARHLNSKKHLDYITLP